MSIVSRLLERRLHDTYGVRLEPMRRRHLKEILAIENQVYPKPWTPGVFQSEIEGIKTGERYYVVARRAGVLVGYAGMLFAPDEAHVTNIAVDPAQQRGGVGRTLLCDLAWTARERSLTAMSLEVRVSNDPAKEMYRRFGFQPAGIRPKYYENTEDAIVMWCHDIDTPEYAAKLEGLCG